MNTAGRHASATRLYTAALAICASLSACEGQLAPEPQIVAAQAAALSAAPEDKCAVATYGGSEYWFCSTNQTWSAARAKCQARGLDLARINNPSENAFVFSNLLADTWLGGTDTTTEGNWRWMIGNAQFWSGAAAGAPVGGLVTNWKSSQPDNSNNQDCAAMEKAGTGQWLDRLCTDSLDYVCERTMLVGDASVACTTGPGQWSRFHGCSTNQGRSTSLGPPAGSTPVTYDTNGEVESAPAIASNGRIYVGSFDGKLYAFEPNGKLAWAFQTGGPIRSSPAITSNGTILIGSNDNRLYAISSTGTQVWSYLTGGDVRSSPAIGSDGSVYFGSDDNRVYALTSTGTLRWSYLTGAVVRGTAAVSPDRTIYIGSDDWRLYAFNPDGTQRWVLLTLGPVTSSPAIGKDGTVYVGSFDGIFRAIRPGSGAIVWSVSYGTPITSSPAVCTTDGTIAFGTDSGAVVALNSNGTARWSYTTGGPVRSSPARDTACNVYVGSNDNKVYALSAAAGAVLWSATTLGDVVSSPAISASGGIYVGSYDKSLYAIGATEACVLADPRNIQDHFRYFECLGGTISECERYVRAVSVADQQAAAHQYVSGLFTPAQHLALIRDRAKKTAGLLKDPARLSATCAGDTDGDLVPNGQDSCAGTNQLVPTDDNGCPLAAADLPETATKEHIDYWLNNMGIVYDPRCEGAPAPPSPQITPQAFYSGNGSSGLYGFSAKMPTNQPATCELRWYFQVELEHTDLSRNTSTLTFSTQDPTSRFQVALSGTEKYGLFTPRATNGGEEGAWRYDTRRIGIRGMVMNGRGLRSAWSEVKWITLVSGF